MLLWVLYVLLGKAIFLTWRYMNPSIPSLARLELPSMLIGSSAPQRLGAADLIHITFVWHSRVTNGEPLMDECIDGLCYK